MTHTFTTLSLSPAAFAEVREKLAAAGYDHTFVEPDVIDMHGLVVIPGGEPVDMYKSDSDCPLRPCPFCGDRDVREHGVSIQCKTCGSTGPLIRTHWLEEEHGFGKAQRVASEKRKEGWNTRK